jgi:predicted transcriptional regulator
MPNQPKTPGKNIRIPDDLWNRALAVAHSRGESLSAVLRRALERYVKRHG